MHVNECLFIDFNLLELQTAINTVERNVNDMFQYQSHSRSLEARDLALITDNNNYVQKWSIAQIVVIVITTAVQVNSMIILCL